jgi:hypothetical protein
VDWVSNKSVFYINSCEDFNTHKTFEKKIISSYFYLEIALFQGNSKKIICNGRVDYILSDQHDIAEI